MIQLYNVLYDTKIAIYRVKKRVKLSYNMLYNAPNYYIACYITGRGVI